MGEIKMTKTGIRLFINNLILWPGGWLAPPGSELQGSFFSSKEKARIAYRQLVEKQKEQKG